VAVIPQEIFNYYVKYAIGKNQINIINSKIFIRAERGLIPICVYLNKKLGGRGAQITRINAVFFFPISPIIHENIRVVLR
jgi:hypothetical protein